MSTFSAAYAYNGCIAWYNVVLTPRIHSTVKYRLTTCFHSNHFHSFIHLFIHSNGRQPCTCNRLGLRLLSSLITYFILTVFHTLSAPVFSTPAFPLPHFQPSTRRPYLFLCHTLSIKQSSTDFHTKFRIYLNTYYSSNGVSLFTFFGLVKQGIFYQNVYLSVRLSVCHTRESRLTGSRYGNTLQLYNVSTM